MSTVIQYRPDPTGEKEDNLVKDEIHSLVSGQRFRALAPKAGAFFVKSLKLVDVDSGKPLEANIDYIVAELYNSLSLKFKNTIAGVVIITNSNVSNNVSVTYQVLGGEYNTSSKPIADFITAKSELEVSTPNWISYHSGVNFLPNPVVHDLGSNYGFEYVNYALERIRASITWADVTAIDKILNTIKEFIDNVVSMIDAHIDQDMRAVIDLYRKKFTKELAKLDKVVNLTIASELDGRMYGTKNFQVEQESQHKYIITSALMGFKEVLYSVFVSADLTGIGKSYGVIAVPTINTLLNMTNGSTFIFDTIETTQLSSIPMDIAAYPDPTMGDAKWVIRKVINQVDNRGGVFLGFNLKTSEIYTGILTAKPQDMPVMKWIKQITQYDADKFIKQLTDHMEDETNPHREAKFQVGLGEVENLSIVTREDVLCRKPVRKYVTHDALILFMKLFMGEVKPLGQEDPDADIDVAERFRLIFAPCGPCGTQPYTPPSPKPAPPPPVMPRDKLLAVWCNKYDKHGRFSDGFGGTYEKLVEAQSNDCKFLKDHQNQDLEEKGTRLSTYCEGMDLYGKFADGKGSFYVELIQLDATNCGGVSADGLLLVEIRDTENTLIGYGLDTTKVPADPEARTMLTDDRGDGIAYIYSRAKQITQNYNASVRILDPDDNVIGYAIAPFLANTNTP